MAAQPVSISLNDLDHDPWLAEQAVRAAFGAEDGCLGILLVTEYTSHRRDLLTAIHRLATHPDPEFRERLVRPETSYMFGWSHGKEMMNGRPDTRKGSFYVNPVLDGVRFSDEKRAANPEYYSPNVWPDNDADHPVNLRAPCRAIGTITHDVGVSVARACQAFVDDVPSNVAAPHGKRKPIWSMISQSETNKARLLHYYPEEEAAPGSDASDMSPGEGSLANDSLCGTHVDHSLLTGLCSAMYLSCDDPSGDPVEVPAPSSAAGLYIFPRGVEPGDPAKAVKVSIPPNCLAFQLGEALQLLTDSRLMATPHFVSGDMSGSAASRSISRETFAFFLQPDVDEIIGKNGETFGEFTKRILARHYTT